MRLQSSQASCGRAAASNALKALGHDISEQQVDRLLKTIKIVGDEHAADGTGFDTLARALSQAPRSWGVEAPELFSSHCRETAVFSLRGLLGSGRVALLWVDLDKHCVAVIGTVGRRFIICDAADDELVLSYSEGQTLARWGSEGSEHGIMYSGLALRSRK